LPRPFEENNNGTSDLPNSDIEGEDLSSAVMHKDLQYPKLYKIYDNLLPLEYSITFV